MIDNNLKTFKYYEKKREQEILELGEKSKEFIDDYFSSILIRVLCYHGTLEQMGPRFKFIDEEGNEKMFLGRNEILKYLYIHQRSLRHILDNLL